MSDQGSSFPQLADRADAYATWVRNLRLGNTVNAPPADSNSALSRLGNELRLLADSIRQREAEMQKLFDIIREVQQGILVEEVLEKIYAGFAKLIPYQRIGCAFLTDDDATLTAYWSKSTLGAIQLRPGYCQPMAGSSLEPILRTGAPRVLNDLRAHLIAKPGSASTRLITREGGRASLTCPLIIEDRPIGFLFFTSNKKNAYRRVHQTIFLQIAAEVANVIHKSRLYQRLVETNRDLARQSSLLREIANRDSLTNILNRGAVMAALDRKIAASAAARSPFGVIMIDIDYFKQINDAYGHAAGDAVLCEVSRRLSQGLRQNDEIGRYGGEEFLVLIGDSGGDALLRTAERLRGLVADAPFEFEGVRLPITASLGVASASAADTSTAALLKAADAALYRAKAAGRNRCEAADE